MTRTTLILTAAVSTAMLAGCARQDADGPPEVRLGDSICAECGMILSDERFATATLVEGPRGPEPRLFDDFNCQVNWEVAHPNAETVARWSHDHGTTEWVRTEAAHFVCSPALRTPMASRVAAFASAADAEAMRERLGGDVMDFETLWRRVSLNGGACAPDQRTQVPPRQGDADATDAD